jgi:uncharacterized protein
LTGKHGICAQAGRSCDPQEMASMTLTVGSPRNEAAAPLIEALSNPAAFPHAVTRLELRQTHISWIVLTGALAYKIKKPLELDFIDTSTLERRLLYCNEEVRLNRRLAPDLYLDVVPITRSGDAIRVGGGPAEAIEYAVRMKQFDSADELSNLLERDAVALNEITALAELLARFHESTPSSAWSGTAERTEQMYDAVLGNAAQLMIHARQLEPLTGLEGLLDWTYDTGNALEPSFRAREQGGYVRDGHGDLHCNNIVRFGGRLVPFDCIDFNARLRWIDVMNDLAFLVMDLVSRGRSDLASALLSKYLEITGDYAGVRLLPFYAVYRALVRAKVDAIAAEQSPAHAAQFRDRLRRRIQAAIGWIERPRPALMLMHGLSGSGKSWLSEQLVAKLPALRIRSDLERKRLAGVRAGVSAAAALHSGIYAPEISHRTYARLAECAESCLQAGFNVIVDASFLEAADRELLRGLAMRLRIPFMIVSCEADPATLSARVQARAAQRNDPSDADHQVLKAQLDKPRAFTAAEQPDVIIVDTRDPGVLQHVAAAMYARM